MVTAFDETIRCLVPFRNGITPKAPSPPDKSAVNQVRGAQMKVSGLTDAYLDYWTGRAAGIPASELSIEQHQRGDEMLCVRNGARYAPSTDWAHGGQIVDKVIALGIGITPSRISKNIDASTEDSECIPYDGNWKKVEITQDGPTVMIAVCRAYVASRFGDEVPNETTCGSATNAL